MESDLANRVSGIQVTCQVVQQMMDTLVPGLSFTTENGEEFEGGWLPTLDVQVKMEKQTFGSNAKQVIRYKFYEKPMNNVKIGEA